MVMKFKTLASILFSFQFTLIFSQSFTERELEIIYNGDEDSLFKEGYQTQKLHQKATQRVMDEVAKYRETVDKVIFEIWEEVEKSSNNIPVDQRIERNREYGVVYYYRKGEIS
jgi:hypothetical protein